MLCGEWSSVFQAMAGQSGVLGEGHLGSHWSGVGEEGSERTPGRDPGRTMGPSLRWARLGQEQLGDEPMEIGL